MNPKQPITIAGRPTISGYFLGLSVLLISGFLFFEIIVLLSLTGILHGLRFRG